MQRRIFISIILLSLIVNLKAQEKQRDWTLNGHLQTLQMIWIPPSTSNWETMGTLNNRLDFRWNPAKFISFHIGGRNIFNYGQLIKDTYPFYADLTVRDAGYFNLTKLWVKDSSYFFYSNADRANVKLTWGKFEATLGRQRINWGINLVWTPNDIFNSFNYFDFDYVERPGCDAVLLQYFTGYTSSLQFGFKMDSDKKITSALMYNFNKWNYDFQFLGGVMRTDVVAGLGWSGSIKGAGFNGEVSYFRDQDKFRDTTGVLVGSVGANYTLKNGLFFHAAYLFNSAGTTGPASPLGFNGFGSAFTLNQDISAKSFTRAKQSLFAEVSYPITPLIKGDISSIFNPNDKSGFAGPSLDISLTDNISFFVIGQLFWGNPLTEYGDYGSIAYFRLKWNF